MSLDINLLSILKERKEYARLVRTVNDRAFDQLTMVVLSDFGKFFEEFPDVDVIPLEKDFLTWFTVHHRTVKPEQMAVYHSMLRQAAAPVNDAIKASVVSKLLEANMAVLVSDIADRWTRGDEVNIAQVLRGLVDGFEADVERKVRIPYVEIGDNLFKDAVNNTGLTWRTDALNLCMRPLRVGDFGVVAARPDAGKTSFIADNITWMAQQIPAQFENPNRPILWFNNEGPGERIQERVIQSALALPASQLVKLQKSGELWSSYASSIGGDMLRIRVIDIHGWKSWQVLEVIKQANPAVVVFDMIDNIRFDGELANNGSRTDQVLEAMYQWARDAATVHKFIGIATSQISADGEGLAYPTQAMLKDSKTGKQGACDFIVTLGKKNEPAYEQIRFIGCTKNKLSVEGQKRSPTAEVMFDHVVGRFYPINYAPPSTHNPADTAANAQAVEDALEGVI
jgi:replicative DNA helicase